MLYEIVYIFETIKSHNVLFFHFIRPIFISIFINIKTSGQFVNFNVCSSVVIKWNHKDFHLQKNNKNKKREMMRKIFIFMYKFTEAILCFGLVLNRIISVLHKYPSRIPFTSFLRQSLYRGSKIHDSYTEFPEPTNGPCCWCHTYC